MIKLFILMFWNSFFIVKRKTKTRIVGVPLCYDVWSAVIESAQNSSSIFHVLLSWLLFPSFFSSEKPQKKVEKTFSSFVFYRRNMSIHNWRLQFFQEFARLSSHQSYSQFSLPRSKEIVYKVKAIKWSVFLSLFFY